MKIPFIMIVLLFLGCSAEKETENKSSADSVTVETQQAGAPVEHSYSNKDPLHKETKVRFKTFSLILHGFNGYDYETEDGSETRLYGGQFGGGSDLNEAVLNDNEKDNDDYIESLVALKDTVHISESLVEGGNDNKLNQTLLQIVPHNKNDQFRISYSYLTTLAEIFDDKNLDEAAFNKLHKNRFIQKENTVFTPVKDSVGLYFRLTLLDDHRNQAWYTNGTMSKLFYQKDLERIKKKYQMKDTLIQFSGEGGSSYATLTKDHRIFGYDSESYLIRIDRLNNGKLVETKCIVVYIAYGC